MSLPPSCGGNLLRANARVNAPLAGNCRVFALAAAEAYERLADEAALVSFLIGGPAPVRMGNTVRVHVTGVEGLTHDVSFPDALEAFRNELANLEAAALTRGMEVTGAKPTPSA